MSIRSYAAALSALASLVTGCGERTRSHGDTTHVVRVEQSTRTFYPRNPGCTFDGVPGLRADIQQMHKAKLISPQCFAPEARAEAGASISRTFNTANPGCTLDGKDGSTASTEQILNAKDIAPACYLAPAPRQD